MSGQKIKHHPNNRRRLSQLLIIIGSILTVTGMILFFINTGSSYDDTEQTIEEPLAMEDEIVSSPEPVEILPSTEISEEDSENIPTVPELDVFTGDSSDFEGVTFIMADGTIQQESEGPAFHTVSAISSAVGINPKTNEDSDNLLVILSALPDREMSISVLVSVDQSEISGTNPDLIQGVQWILTYSGGEFKKTERSVTDDGMITQLAAEGFNIRFIGNETNAEIEFFGPLDTQYYAVMIYDETYFTLIRP